MADPPKQNVLKLVVGRATPSISLRAVRLSNGVPACSKPNSGCWLARDHPPGPGSDSLWFRPEARLFFPSLDGRGLRGDFIFNLSVFDLVLNCGPKAHDILVNS